MSEATRAGESGGLDEAKILKRIAQGAPLQETLAALALLVEQRAPDVRCGICVFDRDLCEVSMPVGPSLPEAYNLGLRGFSLMAPYGAPCALAAQEKMAVAVPDIENDDRWPFHPWRALAVANGLRSCFSTPIIDSKGRVCATFVVYSTEVHPVDESNAGLAETAANLASIAIERENDEAERKEREERLWFAIEGADVGTWDWNLRTDELFWSDRCLEFFGLAVDELPSYDRFLEKLHPDDVMHVDEAVQNSLRENIPYDTEYRVRMPHGGLRWVAAKGATFRNADGVPTSMRGIAIDITARKGVEQQAADSAARFRFLAESLPHKIFTASAEGEIDYLNQQWGDYTGISVEKVMELGWREFVHPEDMQTKRVAWESSMKSGTPFECEHRFRNRSGNYRWHLSRAHPFRDASGRILLWVGSNTDIDELKRSHFDLQEREERFRSMADATPVLIWMADLSKGCTYFNKKWLEFTGRTTDQERGDGWLNGVHADDVVRCAEIYDRSFDRREAFQMEYRLRRWDGAYRWLLDCGQPLQTVDGVFVGFIGGCVDIHEQKVLEYRLRDAESRARLAVEAAGMGFWDWSIRGSVEWSPETTRILGLNPDLREGSFSGFLARVHPEDRESVAAALDRTQTTHEDFDSEFRVVDEDGSIRWIAGHGRAFFDEESRRASRMVGVVRDITQRRTSEEQIRKNQEELRSALASAELAREQAETASLAKDRFLAVLSHELRTPLTPVLMAVSTVRADRGLSDASRAALEMIQRNVKIEARLIDDLLDLTRIARNQLEIAKEPVDLHLAVTHAVEVCAPDIQSKSLSFRVDLSATAHEVIGDLARLQQVFWNLIKNAVKFTPAGGSIAIRSFNQGSCVLVEVSDTGMGISQEFLPRIFEPFEQGSPSFVRQFGGLGLGLAICKATVEAHSGSLTVQSSGPGRGSTFLVELSLASHLR